MIKKYLKEQYRVPFFYTGMLLLLLLVAFGQGWSVALSILNLCLISAIMAIGVNIQWGYAGLFNVGVMGFAALGGLASVIISMPAVYEARSAGGVGVLIGFLILVATVFISVLGWKKLKKRKVLAYWFIFTIGLTGYCLGRFFFVPAVNAIEAVNPSVSGYLGGFGLPILFAWPAGGLLAAGAAYVIGKVALGLRSDYLAIATLGISEIILYFLKNEEWLTRGVKNVNGLPRPVPYEVNLQEMQWFQELASDWGMATTEASSLFVKLCYAGLFIAVVIILMYLSELALKSPWGRMMRAIRDNETAAAAMGKDVVKRHLIVFVIGSAVIGMAGAMLTTLDGQFTPLGYQPLRFTFLIWVMVIIGGSGNNWGAVLGGFFIWFFWIEAEPIGLWLIEILTSFMDEEHWLRTSLIENAAHMRLATVGIILLLALRYFPDGLLPEQKASGDNKNRNKTSVE
jgi:branched-chain amino acid transport system permease protein